MVFRCYSRLVLPWLVLPAHDYAALISAYLLNFTGPIPALESAFSCASLLDPNGVVGVRDIQRRTWLANPTFTWLFSSCRVAFVGHNQRPWDLLI